MGQYYVPTLINEKGEMKTFYSHSYDNGLKLMEHSWIGNNFVAAVLHELLDSPHRVWWLGDYAEDDDFNEKDEEYNSIRVLNESERKEAWSKKHNINPNMDNQKWIFNNAFLINHEYNCYIKLEECNNNIWQICPLPLLTSVGNGKGGGDYHGINETDCGTWSGDLISISFDEPVGMKDVTLLYYFEED